MLKERRGNRRGILDSEGTSVPIESVGEAISSASGQGVGQHLGLEQGLDHLPVEQLVTELAVHE